MAISFDAVSNVSRPMGDQRRQQLQQQQAPPPTAITLGMHCLGAVAGSSSTGGLSNNSISGNCGSVLSVVRALGVLVCEGRIQGSPRGYKEGPHCTAPLQSSPNHHHQCDKENYLCNRYLVLVKEIADRTAIGASLCVEVFMCSDCQCGLSTVTSNDPVSPISFTSITQWPHSCEMLLEYWCIGIVPTKSSEMMNSQGLYQAVRSRLHFSQVAAWWSRSNGTKPAYVATRIVPYNIDNRRKFRETPIKHQFPLASIGDGYSVEVTVWALPRMEDVPTIICPVHLPKDNMKDDECSARALTPTKNIVPSSRIDVGLVLPSLVDDRLQTPCNKPGKHHCHCEDEDGSPPSPSIKPNGERKRRRSLPCGPPDANSSTTLNNLPLASVSESNSLLNGIRDVGKNPRERERAGEMSGYDNRSYLGTGNLERCFKTQVSLEAPEGNVEKRYKPSSDILTTETSFNNSTTVTDDADKFKSFVPFIESQSSIHPLEIHHNGDGRKSLSPNGRTLTTETITTMTPTTSDAMRLHYRLPMSREPNLVVNPFAERSSFHESNPGPSTLPQQSTLRNNSNSNLMSCTVHLDYSKSNKSSCERPVSYKLEKEDVKKNSDGVGKDLSNLMSKLSFPKESNGKIQKEEGGILDWISKVPSRVLTGPNNSAGDEKKLQDDSKYEQRLQQQQNQNHQVRNAVKFKNCNLELSQREFDEVLAVLRARTPSARRRTPVKTLRRRERAEKPTDSSLDKNSMRCVPLERCVCPIHREIQPSSNSMESNICQLCKNSTAVYRSQVNSMKMNNETDGDRKQFGKSSDCLQNVSNKADVLLGAILRTSRDRRGLSDISNGARPRTNSYRCETAATTTVDTREEPRNFSTDEHGESRIVDSEEDKFFPAVLNKRLNRFKQLFRKDQDKKETIDVSNTKQYRPNNDSLGNAINTNRIKRTITKSPVTINKSSVLYQPLINDNSNIEQGNFHHNSTNYKFNEINNQSMDASKRKDNAMSSINRGDKSGHDNVIVIDGDMAQRKNMDRELKNNNNKTVIDDESIDIVEDETADKAVPSAIEQERFRRSLENAASMVFHSRTGLPLTSSPAPLRRGSCCFDYDSSLNSVSSKRSALFELNTPPSPGAVSLEEVDREVEYCGEGDEIPKRLSSSRSRPQSHALLGSFEESALNGRLEPVSTVHGFTAEIGASGSFCPKHRKLPVTVFFYTLGDNDKVSTPYLAHLNLGKKGYQVPRSGTIQVTLSNPLGTVVKMFVVLYDLSDMPPRSHTFLRQRTLRDKTLRYLIHLRFMSGKSGRIYLHTDIRIIICRRSDVDTASDFSSEPPKELRSYIHGPTNPKFSPRC